jgi:Ca2+/Na+ antiporter
MNEMYSMGLSLHSVGGAALLAVVFLNLFMLIAAKDLKKYRRLMSIFLIPLTQSVLGFVIFSGVVMMAAKHLSFSVENIVMIIISLVFIVIEVKRIKSLKYLDAKKERALELYKPFARRLLQIEFIMTLLISLWMWFA